MPVLFCQTLFVLGYMAEHLLEPEYLVFESFDVKLFALAVGSAGGLAGVKAPRIWMRLTFEPAG